MSTQAASPVLGNKRSYEKCEPCRAKKIKCTPEERDWVQSRQKCDPCIKANLPCGHNERKAARKTTGSSGPAATPGAFSPPASFSESHNRYGHQQSAQFQYSSLAATPHTSYPYSPSPAPISVDVSSISKSFPRSNSFNANLSPLLLRAQEKLPDLGTRTEVLVTLQSRARAVSQMRKAFAQKKLDAEIESAIESAIQCVRDQYIAAFRDILKLAEGYDNAESELLHRRLVSESRRLLALPTTHDQDDNLEEASEGFRDVYTDAIDRLADIYENKNDFAEADRLRLQKAVLTLDSHTRCSEEALPGESEAFIRTSTRVTQTFGQVLRDLLPRVKKVFVNQGDVQFPPAHLALLAGRTKVALEMYRQGKCDLHAKDILGRDVLHLAAETSNLSLLKYVVSTYPSGPIKMERDKFCMTPMLIAAYVGNFDVFKCIYDRAASRSDRDIEARNVLCIASRAGHYEIVRYLLQNKHKAFDDENLCSPLHEAAAAGFEEIVQILLNHKAEPRLEHKNQKASEVAKKAGHVALAQFLEEIERKREQEKPMELNPSDLKVLQDKICSAIRESESPESVQYRPYVTESSIDPQWTTATTTPLQTFSSQTPQYHAPVSQHGLTYSHRDPSPAVSCILTASDTEAHPTYFESYSTLVNADYDDTAWA